jgi:hypothetical protein
VDITLGSRGALDGMGRGEILLAGMGWDCTVIVIASMDRPTPVRLAVTLAGCVFGGGGGVGRYHVMYHEDGVEEWLTLPSLDVHLVPPSARNAPPRPLRFWEPGDAVLCRRPRPSDAVGGPAEPALYPARVEWLDAETGRIRVSFDEDRPPPPTAEKALPSARGGGETGVEMSLEHVRAYFSRPPISRPPSPFFSSLCTHRRSFGSSFSSRKSTPNLQNLT